MCQSQGDINTVEAYQRKIQNFAQSLTIEFSLQKSTQLGPIEAVTNTIGTQATYERSIVQVARGLVQILRFRKLDAQIWFRSEWHGFSKLSFRVSSRLGVALMACEVILACIIEF